MGKEIWQVVSENLQAGMTVRNWTVNRGYLGDDIIIQDIGENFVEGEYYHRHINRYTPFTLKL